MIVAVIRQTVSSARVEDALRLGAAAEGRVEEAADAEVSVEAVSVEDMGVITFVGGDVGSPARSAMREEKWRGPRVGARGPRRWSKSDGCFLHPFD
ncbi:hypothetical protein [Methyloraptor flagellatus]|uniref:Uncharacterized protein n=1 Tax=Methyloraptor flagellatus TaxID=3162530 RepID=A0AAU7X9L3_9HYPH